MYGGKEMDEGFIRDRITELRMQRNISEYRMSLELGHSKGYIQSISSGRSMPSMAEFLAICDFLHVTPSEFFAVPTETTGKKEPNPDFDLEALYLKLSSSQKQLLREIMMQMK